MTALGKHVWLKTSPTFPKVTGYTPLPHHVKPKSSHEYDFLQFSPGEEPETIETDVVIVGSGCGGAVCAKNLAEAGHRVLVADKAYHFPASQLPMTEEAGGVHLYENGGAVYSDDGSIVIVAGSSWGGGGTVNWSASLQTQSFVRKEWAQDMGLTFFETAEFQECLDRVCDRMGASAEHVRHNHGNRVLLEGSRKLGYHAKAVPQNTGGTEHYCGHCTQTQSFVRKEWAQDMGLTFFETAEFQECLDRVCDRMGASAEHVRHNHGNRVLLEGSRKLGYHAKAVPQNTGGTEHYCGHCTMGCGSGQKQGPVVSWLPDATKAGAEFMEGFTVDHVIFDESSGVKKAVGVKGKWVSRSANDGVEGPLSGRTVREVIVRAKKVIISCGSLWSPIILLNSGLKVSNLSPIQKEHV